MTALHVPHKARLLLAFVLLGAQCIAGAQSLRGDGFVSGPTLGLWSGATMHGHGDRYAPAGVLAYTSPHGWGGQIDLARFVRESGAPERRTSEAASRIFYRNDRWLLGGLLQTRKLYGEHDELDMNDSLRGLEGQLYLDRLTLSGQVGRERFEYDSAGARARGEFLSLGVNYFLHDNLRIDGGIGLVQDGFAGAGSEQLNLNIGAEYRLYQSPFSLFANYTHVQEEDDAYWDADAHMALIGARYSFGRQTLLERNRQGTGLRLAPSPLPR
jgi:hypothetical protein